MTDVGQNGSPEIAHQQRKGRFWPGFSWRVLAHKRIKIGRATVGSYLPNHQFALSSDEFLDPIEFDELVIDHWLHIEQMNDRDWWIGLGTAEDGVGYEWMINVHIDRFGRARTNMERE